jgi:hypothetical protein
VVGLALIVVFATKGLEVVEESRLVEGTVLVEELDLAVLVVGVAEVSEGLTETDAAEILVSLVGVVLEESVLVVGVGVAETDAGEVVVEVEVDVEAWIGMTVWVLMTVVEELEGPRTD